MKWLGQYSNGWGHVILSILFGLIGAAMILVPWTDGTTKGLGTAIITTVMTYWFVSNSSKVTAMEIAKQIPAIDTSDPLSTRMDIKAVKSGNSNAN